MEKIYSKVHPNVLLHLINRLDEIEERTYIAIVNDLFDRTTKELKLIIYKSI